MKKFILISFSFLLIGGCMKHDVLKQDATGNFRDSDFYQSGEFETGFTIIKDDSTYVQTAVGGSINCKPVFSIRLPYDYANKISNSWDGILKVTVFDDRPGSADETFVTYNYAQKFNVISRPSVECGSRGFFKVKIELITPSSLVMATTTREFFIKTP